MKKLSVVVALFVAAVAFGFAKKQPPAPTPSPSVTLTPSPAPSPSPLPTAYPATGWNEAYDTAIKEAVTSNMLNQPASRMTKFCDAWATLTETQKRQMFADLLYSISKPESNYNRASMYVESTMGKDSKTGLPVISEGFLQLSYQDIGGYPTCAFPYTAAQKKFHEDDWNSRNGKSSWNSKHVNEKTILDPFINLKCGIVIIDKLLTTNKTTEFADRLGAYWSTMRRGKSSYQTVWTQMNSRKTPCK